MTADRTPHVQPSFEVSRLGRHTKSITYGTSQASNDKAWGYPTLRIPNIIGGSLTTSDLTYVDAPAASAERFAVQRGDILVVRTNGNPNYVGRCAVFQPPDPRHWLFASYLMRVRLNQGDLVPQFVAEYLNSARGRRELLRRVTTSAGNYNINAKNIASVPIPRPSPEAQVSIVSTLEAVNVAMERTRRASAAASIVKRGLMQACLPPWLGVRRQTVDLSDNHDIVRADSVARIFNGSTPSRSVPAYWRNGAIPWLATGQVNDRIIKRSDECVTEKALAECSIALLPKGSVLVAMIGQGKTRGMCAYTEIDACINQNFGAFVPGPRLIGKWLYHYFDYHYTHLREMGGGTNQGALNCFMLKRIRLPIPPSNIQRVVVDRLDACEAIIACYENTLSELDGLKRGLLHDLLSGKRSPERSVNIRESFPS